MPKETVRGADYNVGDLYKIEGDRETKPWPAETRLPVVEVIWHKHPAGHVEIASCDDSLLNGPDGLYAQVAKAVAEGADVEVVIRGFFSTGGLWVNLNRDGCNRLIKVVREARNGAFQRDE